MSPAPMDPNMMAGMMPPPPGQTNMGGMMPSGAQDVGPATVDEIGQIKEMKDIYDSLLKVKSILTYYGDAQFDPIKRNTTKAMEMFNDIIMNYDMYKTRVPQMVAEFTDLVKLLTNALGDALKNSNDDTDDKINDNEEMDEEDDDETENPAEDELTRNLFGNNDDEDDDKDKESK